MSNEEDLIDYSDEELQTNDATVAEPNTTTNGTAIKKGDSTVTGGNADKKGSYVGIHSTGFRDFLLKPELLRAITDCGFEHPSEGQSWIFSPALSKTFHVSTSVHLRRKSYFAMLRDPWAAEGSLFGSICSVYRLQIAIFRSTRIMWILQIL